MVPSTAGCALFSHNPRLKSRLFPQNNAISVLGAAGSFSIMQTYARASFPVMSSVWQPFPLRSYIYRNQLASMQACFLNQQAAQPSAAEKSFHSSCGRDEPLITHHLLLQNRRALSGQGRCEGCRKHGQSYPQKLRREPLEKTISDALFPPVNEQSRLTKKVSRRIAFPGGRPWVWTDRPCMQRNV